MKYLVTFHNGLGTHEFWTEMYIDALWVYMAFRTSARVKRATVHEFSASWGYSIRESFENPHNYTNKKFLSKVL